MKNNRHISSDKSREKSSRARRTRDGQPSAVHAHPEPTPSEIRTPRRLTLGRTHLLVAAALALSLLVVGGLWAQQRRAQKRNAQVEVQTSSALTSSAPAKEYVYAGGRLVATEEPTGTSPTPTPNPTPTPTPPPSAAVNLALNKPAAQSSTYPNSYNTSAASAVDGNTSGVFTDSTVTSTNNETQAWWQVDLGQVGTLDRIDVWNRTDCCPERLSNFYVLVSDVPFTSTDLNTARNQAGVSSYYMSGNAGSPSSFTINRTGRYVRVQLAGTNYLSLAEVQVWGGAPAPTPTPTPTPTPPSYGVSSSPSVVAPGGTLTVNWTAPAGHPSLDWVGLYRVGAPDDEANMLWWAYTGAATAGTMTTSAPAAGGQYEFRMFANDGFTRVATGNTFTVQ